MSTAPSSVPTSRIAELDALRGLAAISVVLYHYLTRYQELFGRTHPVRVDYNMGGSGVWLFFMLSGYVIFMTLDRARSVEEFLVSRFARLFPAFWAAVIVTFVVLKFWGLPDLDVGLHDAVLNLTMLPRVLHAEFVDGVYWSLEPELMFYFCMAVLFVAGGLKRIRLILAVWLLVGALSHVVLATMDQYSSLYRLMGRLKTASCLEFIHLFAIGMIFYDVRRAGGTWTRSRLLLLAAALGMTFWYLKLPDAVITLALAGTLYLATTGRLPFLNWRPLLWLGLISYPLYLTHQNMGYIPLHHLDQLGWNPYLATAVVSIGAIAVAALFSYGVEYPVMRRVRSAMKKQRLTAAAAQASPTSNAQPALPNAAL